VILKDPNDAANGSVAGNVLRHCDLNDVW